MRFLIVLLAAVVAVAALLGGVAALPIVLGIIVLTFGSVALVRAFLGQSVRPR